MAQVHCLLGQGLDKKSLLIRLRVTATKVLHHGMTARSIAETHREGRLAAVHFLTKAVVDLARTLTSLSEEEEEWQSSDDEEDEDDDGLDDNSPNQPSQSSVCAPAGM